MTVTVHNPNQQAPITLTDKAARYVQNHLAKIGQDKAFRLYVTTAGCTGYMYKVDYVDHIDPEDLSFNITDELTIYVEKKTYPLVRGTEIDIEKKGLNEVLVFNNPNSTANCGCGESFTIEDQHDNAN